MATCETDEHIAETLGRPEAFPHQPASVALKETHTSWVFIAGDLVYKVKKPVRFDFLDFSTIARRERACRDELRLNRRLAPGVYLDVVPITLAVDRNLRFGGTGTPIDWAVCMRRLPDDKMLDALVRNGQLRFDQVDRLAETLAGFYSRLTPASLTADEYRRRLVENIQDNRRELLAAAHHLPVALIKRIHAVQLQCLALRGELFDERVATGHIVEGHGDLRPEHVCLTDPPVVFDCLEFNQGLRTLDVADDLAFFAEECDYLGAVWVGERLISRFRKLTGERLDPLLWAFYKSYRACVRAKVAALRAEQIDGADRDREIGRATNYLKRAHGYLRYWERPLILVVGGLSGVGKTTLAIELADKLGADLLRTDVIRRQLHEPDDEQTAMDEGIYHPMVRRQVYEAMLAQAASLHRDCVPLILDGTFASNEQLLAARRMVANAGTCFLAVECICRPEVALRRIRQRLATGKDASAARPDIFEQQRQQWQPWPDNLERCRIDSEQPLDSQVAQVTAAMGSVAESVMRRATCPVLTYKAPRQTAPKAAEVAAH